MQSLLQRIRGQKGYTLVEVLVVVVIIGMLAAVSFTIVTSIFTITLRSAQLQAQNAATETVFGFLGSRLAVTQTNANQIGFTEGAQTGVLKPNDLYFYSAREGTGAECYRIHYDKDTRDLKMAIGDGGSACVSGNSLQNWSISFSSIESNPPENVSIVTLAEGIIPSTNGSGAEAPADSCQKYTPGALDNGSLFTYGGATSGNSVSDVTVSLASCPTSEPNDIAKVPPKFFSQTFSIGQLCLIGGGTGGTPDDNSINPSQIKDFPVAAAQLTDVATSAETGSWYKVAVPGSFASSLWGLTPGFYNLSAQANFSWAAAAAPTPTDGAAVAIVKNGNILVADSARIIDNDAYASVSTGVSLLAGDTIEVWVRTTGSTPSRFQNGRISGTWQN